MKQRIPLTIPSVLIEERKKKGNRQEDLAQRCGVTKSAVSKWGKGNLVPLFNNFLKLQIFMILPFKSC